MGVGVKVGEDAGLSFFPPGAGREAELADTRETWREAGEHVVELLGCHCCVTQRCQALPALGWRVKWQALVGPHPLIAGMCFECYSATLPFTVFFRSEHIAYVFGMLCCLVGEWALALGWPFVCLFCLSGCFSCWLLFLLCLSVANHCLTGLCHLFGVCVCARASL